MLKIEDGVHGCFLCHKLVYRPAKITHRNNPDGMSSFRHLRHGSTNLLNETSITTYAGSHKEARRRALMLLENPTISERTRREEMVILEELDRMEIEYQEGVETFLEVVTEAVKHAKCQ